MKKLAPVFLFLLLLACSGLNQAQDKVDAILFDSLIQAMPDAQLLDVRTPEEFGGGHIGNALNMDIRAVDFEQQIASLDKNKPVLVYCLSGGRSHSAAGKIKALGYTVTELDGGIAAWKSHNMPVEGVNMAGKSTMDRVAFMAGLDSGVLHLVDFNAKWCLPCRKLLPIADSLSRSYDKLELQKVDYDSHERLAREFGVEGLPYLLLIRDGEVVWSHFGLPETAELIKAIEQNLPQ